MAPLTRAPVIGLTTYGRNEENKFNLPAEYVEGVRRAGGLPILIAPGEEKLAELFELIDGLVLTGGGDINPKFYGGAAVATNYGMDEDRDRLELRIGRLALETGLPTLGICRGMQILNTELGGTLHQHIPDEFGETVKHRLPPREPTPHPIKITDKHSKLFDIVGVERFDAPSWHHQALKDVAAPFKVVALADDGVIEAAEIPSHPWLVCVQWHPELSAAEDPIQQRLFDQLINAATHGARDSQDCGRR